MNINNTPHPLVTLLPRTQAFYKVLHSAVLGLSGEYRERAIARGNGKAKHFFFSSLSVSSFVSLYLIIKYLSRATAIKNYNISKQFKLIKVFRCSFRETIPIFFTRLNSYLISLSFTSD